MKILQINNCYYRRGGADIAFFNTIDLLKQNGHDVFTFSMADTRNEYSNEQFFFPKYRDIRKLGFFQKILHTKSYLYNTEAYKKLLLLLEKKQPDIAHVHLFMGTLSSSILKALRKKKVPVIITIHDYRLICPAYLFLDGSNKICERCKTGFYANATIHKCSEGSLLQSLVLSADAYFRKYIVRPKDYINHYIFVSKFIKEKHIEFDKLYSYNNSTLYNFIADIERIEPNHKKGEYFLYFGRLSREKGIETLIRAARLTKVSLKIVGTGPLLEKYSKDNDDNISFLGKKNGEELWNIVKNASFIIVPSEWYENNPLTILESYALGKPVIASEIGGIPELIQKQKNGFMFQVGNVDELSKLLLNANSLSNDTYEKMSREARAFAETNFSPDIHYSGLLSIYKNNINNN